MLPQIPPGYPQFIRTISTLSSSEMLSQTKGYRMLYKMLRDASLLVLSGLLMKNAGLNTAQMTQVMKVFSGTSTGGSSGTPLTVQFTAPKVSRHQLARALRACREDQARSLT